MRDGSSLGTRLARVEAKFPPGAVDGDAIRVLHELPLDCALEILNDLEFKGGSVRNPSAFVTARARSLGASGRGGGGGPRPPPQPEPEEDLEGQFLEIVESLGLDELAVSLLREVPIEDALNMVTTLVEQRNIIRNFSAFITRQVHNFQQAGRPQLPPARPLHRPGMPLAPPEMNPRGEMHTRPKQELLEEADPIRPRGPPPWAGNERRRSRSRSRHNMPAHDSATFGNRLAKIEASLPGGALDADAVTVLQELPPENANTLLNDLEHKGPKLNNPSAFVTSRARQLLGAMGRAGGPRPPQQPEEDLEGAYNEIVDSLGLDDKAQELLREVPLEEATMMLQTLVEQRNIIGNFSAFITREVRNFQHAQAKQSSSFDGANRPMPRTSLPPEIEDMIARSELDTRAKEVLSELPDDEIVHLLHELREKDNIRNPSAFVFRAATNRAARLPLQGDSRDRPPPRFEDDYRDDRRMPPARDRFAPVAPPSGGKSNISERLLGLCEEAGLSRAATDHLRTLSPDGALDVLQSLRMRKGQVADTSEWVMYAVDQYNDGVHPDSLPNLLRPAHSHGKGGFAPPMRGPPMGGRDRDRDLVDHLEELLRQAPPSLDSRARGALQELHPAEAVDLLEDVLNKQDEIRNVSAFVFRAVTIRTSGKGGGPAGAPPRRHLDQGGPPRPPLPPRP